MTKNPKSSSQIAVWIKRVFPGNQRVSLEAFLPGLEAATLGLLQVNGGELTVLSRNSGEPSVKVKPGLFRISHTLKMGEDGRPTYPSYSSEPTQMPAKLRLYAVLVSGKASDNDLRRVLSGEWLYHEGAFGMAENAVLALTSEGTLIGPPYDGWGGAGAPAGAEGFEGSALTMLAEPVVGQGLEQSGYEGSSLTLLEEPVVGQVERSGYEGSSLTLLEEPVVGQVERSGYEGSSLTLLEEPIVGAGDGGEESRRPTSPEGLTGDTIPNPDDAPQSGPIENGGSRAEASSSASERRDEQRRCLTLLCPWPDSGSSARPKLMMVTRGLRSVLIEPEWRTKLRPTFALLNASELIGQLGDARLLYYLNGHAHSGWIPIRSVGSGHVEALRFMLPIPKRKTNGQHAQVLETDITINAAGELNLRAIQTSSMEGSRLTSKEWITFSKLQEAAKSFDRQQVSELVESLVSEIPRRDQSFPLSAAHDLLGLLRKGQYFKEMAKLADVFLASGLRSSRIRRQYAQALIERGNLHAGLAVLEEALEAEDRDTEEISELLGLQGRAHKQLYLNAAPSSNAAIKENLEKAIVQYFNAYHADEENLWLGINAAAMMARARRDKLNLSVSIPESELFEKILNNVAERWDAVDGEGGVEQGDVGSAGLPTNIETRDLATAMEACVGLGRLPEAAEWLYYYVQTPDADAFALASTYRQLKEVWQLEKGSEEGKGLLDLLGTALLKKEGGVLERNVTDGDALSPAPELQEKRWRQLLEPRRDQVARYQRRTRILTPDANDVSDDELIFEKVLGSEGVLPYTWLALAFQRARAIARILDRWNRGIGTGFLVHGTCLYKGWNGPVLLTNAHVVSETQPNRYGALPPQSAIVRFETLERQVGDLSIQKVLWESPPHEFDCAVLQLAGAVRGIEPYAMEETSLTLSPDQRIYVIGHAGGRDQLSFSFYDNHFLATDGKLIHYRSPTEPGSSGSPVFDAGWRLIGIHHAGSPEHQRLGGYVGTYPANEGISIYAIRDQINEDKPETMMKASPLLVADLYPPSAAGKTGK